MYAGARRPLLAALGLLASQMVVSLNTLLVQCLALVKSSRS